MKLLKKLAISTFAFAAFSFIACDNPSTPGVGEPDSPDSPVVDAGSKTITVAITADESRILGVDQVYVYLWSDNEDINNVFGGYPGVALTKDETLGIWSITKDVSVDGTWHVIFNDDSSNKVEGINIKPNESKLYTRARTWIDWDKTSADTTDAYVAPEAPEVPELTEESTVLAIDISKVPAGENSDKNSYDTSTWAEVYVYVWGGSIGDDGWGRWPGKQLTRSEVNENIFYLVVDGDEGSGNFIFNGKFNGKDEQLSAISKALEKGKKYLVTDADEKGFAEWTDFSLDALINKSE